MIELFKKSTHRHNRLIFLHGGMGLGDHFVCNGLVHALINRYDLHEIYLPVPDEQINEISKLYEDYEIVKLFKVDRSEYKNQTVQYATKNCLPLLSITKPLDQKYWDLKFYTQLNFDFSLRWSNFKLPKNQSRSEEFYENFIRHKRYCLIHREFSADAWEKQLSKSGRNKKDYKFEIVSDLPIYELQTGLTDHLLDWIHVIQNAEELHFIDSGPLHLADSLDIQGKKLFYYDIKKGAVTHVKNNWQLLDIFEK